MDGIGGVILIEENQNYIIYAYTYENFEKQDLETNKTKFITIYGQQIELC